MADQLNRKAQRKTRPQPIEPSTQNTELEGSPSSITLSTGGKIEQEERRRRRQGRPDCQNITKGKPNTRVETDFLPYIGNDGCTEINVPSSVQSLTSRILSHQLAREAELRNIKHNEISQPLRWKANSVDSQMNPVRLFIASLGNPPPYSSTRHSAGHILLKALQSHLSLPNFTKSKAYGNGLTSIGAEVGRPEYTLWQSPSLMNVSGAALLKAYKTHIAASQDSSFNSVCGLVILYDEMETSPAQLKLRRGATSAKGHNGVKSVQQSLQSAGLMDKLEDRFVKIGIGIGRPASGSRSSEDVSQYVLGQLTSDEKQGIDAKVPSLVNMLELEIGRMSK